MPNVKNRWLVYFKDVSNPALRLFCFHYAGGSATFCSGWGKYLPDNAALISVQLPGRGDRLFEPGIGDMGTLIEKLIPAIKDCLDVPFAFFGHSMGGAIAYELACELQRRGLQQPVIFFPSGRQAPPFPETVPPIHHLPEAEFCTTFLQRHGTPQLEAIFASQDMRELFVPQLRADMQLSETYSFDAATARKLCCPVVALDGTEGADLIEEHELIAWGEYTTGPFRIQRFPGGHFFIDTAQESVMAFLKKELAPFTQHTRRLQSAP